MAAEYLRDLSTRVHAGQCRVATNGFKVGGRAGFGLRRLLLDAKGTPKVILEDGERKNLAADRVTYTLGPHDEVRVVRDIYSMFLAQDFAPYRIARILNERGVKYGHFGPWTQHQIRLILTHPKYTGSVVFNRTSAKLKSKVRSNPREQWIVQAGVFPAIVSQDVFDRVQEKLANNVIRRSNERLLSELKSYIGKHGKPYGAGPKPDGMASMSTYRYRFGGRVSAYDLIGYRSPKFDVSKVQTRCTIAALRSEAMTQLRDLLTEAGVRFRESKGRLNIGTRPPFLVVPARCYMTCKGIVRWKVNSRLLTQKQGLITIRLNLGSRSIQDFVLYQLGPVSTWGFTLLDGLPNAAITVHKSLGEAVEEILKMPSTKLDRGSSENAANRKRNTARR